MGNQKTSQGFSKKVILSFDNLASFPLEGKIDNLYFDIEKGKMYYWNSSSTEYKVWSDNIEILLTTQPTPTAENNTNNRNKIFKDADGTTWYVDFNGKAISMGSTSLFSLPIYSDNIANVTEAGTDGQFLYITNTGDEFGVIDEVFVWIGGMWSLYPPDKLTSIGTLTYNNNVLTIPYTDETGTVNNKTVTIIGGGLWTTATTNPTATGNTGTLPRFVENTVNGSKWYIDSTGAAKIIELSTVSALRVFVNDLPAVATIFSLENPPVTNDNSLKNLDNAEYIVVSADPLKNGLSYSSNGTTYTAYTIPDKTPWILGGTASTDAGADKTNAIYRKGRVLVATNSSTQTTPLKDLHLQNGGASLLTSAFGSGQIFSTNDSSGPRFFLEHLTAGLNQKTSVIYTQNGITYLGAIVSDNGSTWVFANPLNINHSTGFVGVRTTTPLSNFEVNGSFGANNITSSALTYTLMSNDYTVVMTTAGAVVTLGASVNRRIVNIKNGSTSNITFTGHIDNVASATLTIPSGQSRKLHGNGTTWWII